MTHCQPPTFIKLIHRYLNADEIQNPALGSFSSSFRFILSNGTQKKMSRYDCGIPMTSALENQSIALILYFEHCRELSSDLLFLSK